MNWCTLFVKEVKRTIPLRNCILVNSKIHSYNLKESVNLLRYYVQKLQQHYRDGIYYPQVPDQINEAKKSILGGEKITGKDILKAMDEMEEEGMIDKEPTD